MTGRSLLTSFPRFLILSKSALKRLVRSTVSGAEGFGGETGAFALGWGFALECRFRLANSDT
jgi:hypothetical protein